MHNVKTMQHTARNDRQNLLQRLHLLLKGKVVYLIRYVGAPDAGFIDYRTTSKTDMQDLLIRIGMLGDTRRIKVTEYSQNIHILVER